MSFFHKKPRLTEPQQKLVDTWAANFASLWEDVDTVSHGAEPRGKWISLAQLERADSFLSAREVGLYAARELEAAFALEDRDLAKALHAAAKKIGTKVSPKSIVRNFLRTQELRGEMPQEKLNHFEEKELPVLDVKPRALPVDYVAAFRQVASEARTMTQAASPTAEKLATLEAARRSGAVEEPRQVSDLTLGK